MKALRSAQSVSDRVNANGGRAKVPRGAGCQRGKSFEGSAPTGKGAAVLAPQDPETWRTPRSAAGRNKPAGRERENLPWPGGTARAERASGVAAWCGSGSFCRSTCGSFAILSMEGNPTNPMRGVCLGLGRPFCEMDRANRNMSLRKTLGSDLVPQGTGGVDVKKERLFPVAPGEGQRSRVGVVEVVTDL